MFGNLNEEAIESMLHHQFIGRIGCHSNDMTYVVPVSYAYDGNYVYGHAEEGMKINMMRQNPKVCFEVDTMENMANWQSVITWGNYEEVIDKKEREEALKKLLNRELPILTSKTVQLTPNWPFHPKDLNSIEGIVFRIKLSIKTGRYESSDDLSV
jgi:nitroimidazol reductase NimA-like FMN-containing flavoprotein (pyridoxamine 5'-phosphate oxidase superfamily)